MCLRGGSPDPDAAAVSQRLSRLDNKVFLACHASVIITGCGLRPLLRLRAAPHLSCDRRAHPLARDEGQADYRLERSRLKCRACRPAGFTHPNCRVAPLERLRGVAFLRPSALRAEQAPFIPACRPRSPGQAHNGRGVSSGRGAAMADGAGAPRQAACSGACAVARPTRMRRRSRNAFHASTTKSS